VEFQPHYAPPTPLEKSNARFFGYARAALFHGIKLLGITPGQNVLLPSLICSTAVAPFHALGIHTRYYPVGAHFEPDLDYAARLVDHLTRAFVLVHHFGFPQDVTAARCFCKNHGLPFIEDNAHGFLSALRDTALGSSGDISVFSLRKTLPVPDGAALLVNDPALIASMDGIDLPRSSAFPTLHAAFLLRNLIRNAELLLGKPFVLSLKTGKNTTALREITSGPKHQGAMEALSDFLMPCSLLTKVLIRHFNWELLKLTRITAFSYWSSYFHSNRDDAKPVFSELIPGTVPYVFPVTVADREAWIERMAQQGVECFSWPDLPSDVPEHLCVRDLVAIPLHLIPSPA
jgi:hypothetical protein